MKLSKIKTSIPLKIDTEGEVRIKGSRILLGTIIEAFREGLTSEEIVQQYPTLNLADIYSIIGYIWIYIVHIIH